MAMAVSQLVDIASQPRVTLRWEIVRMDALQGGKDRSVKQVSDGIMKVNTLQGVYSVYTCRFVFD